MANRYGSKIQIDSDIAESLRDCSILNDLSMTETANRILRKRMAEKRTMNVNPLEADMEIPEMASMGSKAKPQYRTIPVELLENPEELELAENPEELELAENPEELEFLENPESDE